MGEPLTTRDRRCGSSNIPGIPKSMRSDDGQRLAAFVVLHLLLKNVKREVRLGLVDGLLDHLPVLGPLSLHELYDPEGALPYRPLHLVPVHRARLTWTGIPRA